METIKSYLENMFANLPNTPEVKKAKDELWQMMEDKYNELIADGVSDNAAVGTVISEFGNLDEIAEELGINKVIEDSAKEVRREITFEEAEEFLEASKKKAWKIAIGVALCIISLVAPIMTDATKGLVGNRSGLWSTGLSDGVGVSFMFVLIAIGVILFIYSSTLTKKWSFLEKQPCSMSIATSEYVKNSEAAFTPRYALMLSIGVALCIISFLPAALLDEVEDYIGGRISLGDMGGACLFIIVAVGVMLIVYAGIVKGSFEKLFKATGRTGNNASGSGNIYTYSDNEKDEKKYISPAAELVMDVFWPTITCIYLIWSFLTFRWYITWVIWPVAAVLDAVLKSILIKRD